MHFASRIIRPPYEARSKFLQVTTACSHNNCSFCSYYRNIQYSVSPVDEIIEDLEELRNDSYSFKRIWLQGADPFSLSFDKLYEIASLIHEYLPFVQSIGGYARIDSLKNKTLEELKILKEVGYNSIVFGMESGDDYLLDYMNKGYKSDDIIEQLSKMDEAELSYTLIFLNGLGGHDYGFSHAIKTADVINRLHPERIMINGLTVFENTQLFKDIKAGKFIESKEKEKILELKCFLERLDVDTFIDATNDSNCIHFFGRIPKNKNAIIDHLQEIYEKTEEKVLRNKRENLNRV